MSYYDIVFNNVINDQLPDLLRTDLNVRWLRVLMTPIRWLYYVFYANRIANLYYLQHNGQVCYLEAVLNDMFDTYLRRIYIVDAAYAEAISLYTRVESHPVVIYTRAEAQPLPLYTRDEISIADSADVFVVMVPVDVTFSEVRMRSLIDKYRLPSMKAYSITTF